MGQVWVVKKFQLNRLNNEFFEYDMIALSSHKKAKSEVDNIIKVNKGFQINNEDYTIGSTTYYVTTYTTICKDTDGSEREARMRLIHHKLQIR